MCAVASQVPGRGEADEGLRGPSLRALATAGRSNPADAAQEESSQIRTHGRHEAGREWNRGARGRYVLRYH